MKLKLIFLFLVFSLISKAQVANAPCNQYSPWVSSTYTMSVISETRNTLFGPQDKWDNKSNLTDSNTSNVASYSTFAVGSAYIEARNASNTQFPAGSYAGFVIDDLDLLTIAASMKVETYLGTTRQDEITYSNFIGTILDGGKRKIGLVATKPFNRIRLTVNTGLNLGVTVNAYYAEVLKPCAGTALACNTNTPVTRPNFGAIVETSRTGLSGLSIGLVANQDNVTNTSTNDSATLSVNAGVFGSAKLSVRDLGETFTAGTFAGFDIQNINLLSLSLFSNITINTYLDGNPKPVETRTGSALFLSLPVLDIQNRSVVGFTATKSFDEIQIVINQPAGLSFGATNVFSAVVKKPCEGAAFECNASTYMTEANYPVSINPSRTGLSGVASAASAVTNPNNILDNSTGNFASITLPASAIASGSISVVKSLSPFAGGTFAGFDIENANLVSVSALSSVTVKTYLGGTLQEEKSGPVLGISAPLFDFQNRTVVGFETTQAFDEVQLVISQPVGLALGTTNVFGLILKKPCEGADLVCNTPTFMTEQNYPVNISSARTGVTGIASAISRVNEPDNVLDSNNDNYATISVPLTAGTTASLSVLKSLSDFPAGTYAGFDIQNVSLINAQFLQNITLKTYNNGIQQEEVSGNGILFGAGTDLLASDGRAVVGIVTTKAFDEVQISLNNVLGFDIGNTRVYKMVTTKTCAKTINCNSSYYLAQPDFPVVLNAQRTGLKTLGCAACSVNNPDNVIDADKKNFSRITLAAGVLNSGSISVLDPSATYPVGTYAGFTVKDRYFFVQGDLLEFITIRTYNNGVLQESKTSTDLLDLTLLFPIWGTGTKNVGFVTTKPFDEVQIETVSITSLINVLDVYGAFIDTRTSSGTGLSCTAVLVANPHAETISAGATGTTSVLANDTYNTAAATLANVTINQLFTENAGVNVDPATGLVTVNAGTTAGTYVVNYQICDKLSQSCSQLPSTATITVPMPVIVATNDAETINEGSTGTVSVLNNDTLNGTAATFSNVNLTQVSTTNSGVTLDTATGNIAVAAGTPAGIYEVKYRICDKVNTDNCQEAVAYITVPVDAIDDTQTILVGSTGTVSVLNNDKYGGVAANTSNVSLSQVSTSNPGVTLDAATGNIVVATGTKLGTYTVEYRICDNVNPATNLCDTAIATVVVSGIIDLKASIGSSKTFISNAEPTVITYSITNIGTAPTNGNLITVTLTKPAFSTGTMAPALIPSGWTKVNETTTLIQFTTNNVIFPNNVIDFAYRYTQTSGTTGTTAIRTIITNGSGGDTVNSNNIASQVLTIIP